MADPKRVRAIFLEAVENHAPDGWRQFLDQACGTDQELRQRVEILLRAHEQANTLLDPAPVPPSATIDQPPAEIPGTTIGPYKLLEHIGEGGMGTVWMAQQTEPVKRLVALKLIKAGIDSKQVIARFEAERQALALMDHPNIARVLDGGTTPPSPPSQGGAWGGGRPYFVMDLVKGVPITRYCDEHHLTPRQRLELFVPVCQAVQHAHQKGIIHRDLKPSNVLVALYDGKPAPKVIDFGVAKATGQRLTDATLFTGFGAVVGTPEYMSPEQAETNNQDIDTRSDIYSLGVLLYELLTGSPPFSRKELEKAGMLEMLRVIREQEPSKPSTKLSTAEGLPTLAANRGTEPAKLTKLVRGELDWIVMKALEKDRNRRYETANGFAADIQRYLADEPVQACPPSVGYRLRKFVRRNRTGVALAGVVVVFIVLLAGVIGWTVSDRAARQARLNYGIDLALQEAKAVREQALTQTENPYQWQTTLAAATSILKRAEELAAQDPKALNAAVAAQLQALRATLDEDERDRRFVERFDEILGDVLVWNDERSKHRRGEPLLKLRSAFQDFYGIRIGSTPVAEAANVIRQRATPIQEHLLAALDVCVARVPVGDAQTTQWLLAVLDQAETDADRKQARKALGAQDWPALEQLAKQAGRQPPVMLQVLVSQLPSFAGREKMDLLAKIRQAYPGEFRAPSRFTRALNYDLLAWMLSTIDDSDWRGNERYALELSKEAVHLAPNDADFWNTLGVTHYRMGNLKEGLAALETAMTLSNGGDGLDWVFVAMIQWRLGNKEEARRMYQQALPWLEERASDGALSRIRAEAAALLGIKKK